MSTAGTLFDETIKNGYSKLLGTGIVDPPNTSVTSIAFSLLDTLGFDSYWFDLSGVRPSVQDHLCMRVFLGGIGYSSGMYHYHSTQILFGSPDNTTGTYTGISPGWSDQFFLGTNCQPTHPLSGRVALMNDARRSDNWKQFIWHTAMYSAGADIIRTHIGSGFSEGSSAPLTTVQFFFGGAYFAYATIRCYGFRMGT